MSEEEIRSMLVEIISEDAALPPDFDRNEDFFRLGITSVSIMKIQVDILKKISVKLKFKEFFSNNTVNKLTQFLVNMVS